jgi:ATP-dependent 26S proteasome regulatory subunit
MKLPFRRGYLLHGPPGIGKTSAIRGMLTSRGLKAYTIRLFDPQVTDRDLDRLFDRAAQNGPSMILLEDLDRACPRIGQSRSQISLQALVNGLDGVATADSVITVATANEPAILDPALLRRPGRFDRVILFPNPTSELRKQYFCRYVPARPELEPVVEESEGFSFAQLRESFVMAGQRAFESGRDVTDADLLWGVRSLRKSVQFRSLNEKSAGFRFAETK